MLPDSALAQIRREHLRLLPDSADIIRLTETHDGGGVNETATTVIASGVPCRLVPYAGPRSASGEQAMADRLALTSPWKVSLPALTDITPMDRLRVTVRGQAARTFEVKYVATGGSNELTTFALLEYVP